MEGLVILAALFGAMWFFTIRPQQQRLKAQRELIAALEPGQIVVTIGGMIGRIVSLDDDEAVVDVGRGAGVEVRVARGAIASRMDTGPQSPVVDE
ncbi:MAG TPA: preprotein translocase subunit YajC [Acidimicrobiales bacterium]|nr:preprotein translocase subunit YajC [Acidimicrobiales bacterium]